MGDRQSSFGVRARWAITAFAAVCIAVVSSCSGSRPEPTSTSRQALDLGGCGSFWLWEWGNPTWNGARTEFIIPQHTGPFAEALQQQISFVDGQSGPSAMLKSWVTRA